MNNFLYIVTIILSFLLGITLVKKDGKETKNENIHEKDESKIKEEKKNEIKETPAADVVTEYADVESASSDITGKQNELRKRIRDRLKQKLHGNGSSGNSPDNS